ncbi:MAG: helix-turn-helix transcriptional regulator [Chloroflexi bacterium]|nr:helix-turn-helix transcriptional regulator [Chloroflexota bacterium]
MTVLARSPAKRRRREETRQRLMEAALSVFARHGYDRATVDEIVGEAGFSKGAFYVHFESKEDLFWAMLEERLARQQEAFRQTLDPGAPLSDNVRTVLRGIFGLHLQDPLWSAMFMEFAAHAARDERVREKLTAMYTSWRTFAVEALDGAREAGAVRRDIDPEFVASLLIAIVEGTISQSRLAPEQVRLEEMIEPLSRTLAEWLSP